MHASENKTKGKVHAAFQKNHQVVDEAKNAWIVVAKTHMQAFYIQNRSGRWSVKSINKRGMNTIPKWKPYPTEAKTEYLRLHALAEALDA